MVQQHAKNTIQVVEAFCATVSVYAEATNSIWPNVLVHDFPGQARRLAELTKAEGIFLNPIVRQEDRASWFNFTMSRVPDMYQEAMDFEHLNTSMEVLISQTVPIIWEVNATGKGVIESNPPGPTIPMWHVDPLLLLGLPITNYNMLADPRMNAAFQSTYSTKMPTLNFVRQAVGDFTGDDGYYVMASQLVQPIFET